MEQETRGKCYECYRPRKNCLCGYIQPFETLFRFVILMHPKEARKQPLGTGRITHKSLVNSEIIIDKNFDHNKRVQSYLKSSEWDCYLLYPGRQAVNLSEKKVMIKGKPLLFILDGTWPCAKSMLRDSPSLHSLPRLSFTNQKKSRFYIKHQPAEYCLSTVESVYEVLSLLEENGIEKKNSKKESMLKALDEMVAFQVQCANDPNLESYKRKKPYKSPSERKPSVKWDERSIIFLD